MDHDAGADSGWLDGCAQELEAQAEQLRSSYTTAHRQMRTRLFSLIGEGFLLGEGWRKWDCKTIFAAIDSAIATLIIGIGGSSSRAVSNRAKELPSTSGTSIMASHLNGGIQLCARYFDG
jgi:hypothetical protein